MTHDLRALLAALLALTAFGALTASAAQAAPEFTAPGAAAGPTTTIVSERDEELGGGAKTAHQVFDISKADGTGTLSITCKEAVATNAHLIGPTSQEVTATIDFQNECKFAGQAAPVNSGACYFIFTPNGQLHIKTDPGVGGTCTHGSKPITFEIPGCKVEIGEQTLHGVKYRPVTIGGKKALTLEILNLKRTNGAEVTGLQYNATGVNCAYGTTTNGQLTTANTIIRGQRPAGTFVDVVWHNETPGPKFHSELTATTITSTADGEGAAAHHVLDVGGGSLTCSGASFHGAQGEREVESLTLTGEYSGCVYLGQATTVNMNGCDYVIHANGEVDVASKSGKNCATEPIKFSVIGCKIEIGPQSGLKEATYNNIEPEAFEEITVEAHITGVKYTATGALCIEPGHGLTNGEYTTGNTILTGAKESEPTKMANIRWTE